MAWRGEQSQRVLCAKIYVEGIRHSPKIKGHYYLSREMRFLPITKQGNGKSNNQAKKKKKSQIFFKLCKFPLEGRRAFPLESRSIESGCWSSSLSPTPGLTLVISTSRGSARLGSKDSHRNAQQDELRSRLLREPRDQAASWLLWSTGAGLYGLPA